jgi:hypothetical protein
LDFARPAGLDFAPAAGLDFTGAAGFFAAGGAGALFSGFRAVLALATAFFPVAFGRALGRAVAGFGWPFGRAFAGFPRLAGLEVALLAAGFPADFLVFRVGFCAMAIPRAWLTCGR